MSSDDTNGELKKAKYYWEAVLKLHDFWQKSYDRINKKIDILIGVLSTVIPILTGIGYVVLSGNLAISFFAFYLASLIVFVYALAKSVYLLLPIRLYAVEVGKIMQRYDEEPLSYVMFKVTSTWEDTIKKSIAKISTIGSNLGEIVKLIIIGLGLLVVSFLLLGVEFYLMESSADPSALIISLQL